MSRLEVYDFKNAILIKMAQHIQHQESPHNLSVTFCRKNDLCSQKRVNTQTCKYRYFFRNDTLLLHIIATSVLRKNKGQLFS